MHIADLAQLRALYAAPKDRAVKKQLAFADVHCQRFIALSPLVVLATSAAAGDMDASPRGGAQRPAVSGADAEGPQRVSDAGGNTRGSAQALISRSLNPIFEPTQAHLSCYTPELLHSHRQRPFDEACF